MANLKELKNQIDSVRSTRKITQAMKMVAASKLRRAQESAESARPYSEKISKIMSSLAISMKDSDVALDLLLGNKDTSVHIVIAVTSDRGLCGGFNSSIVKAVKNKVKRFVMTSSFSAIGYGHVKDVFDESHWTDPNQKIGAYNKSKAIAEKAMYTNIFY